MTARILRSPRSRLDRAILAAIAAMLAFNLFVLAQQFRPAHLLAETQAAGGLQA